MVPRKIFSKLKNWLKPGAVFRRADLAPFSSNVDRHLAALQKEGFIRKINQGLYYCPKETPFGKAPPAEEKLLKAFLKDDHFVVYSPNLFNSLGIGATQLYNQRWVFNRKRFGKHRIGDRTYFFYRWRESPKKLTQEFLLVELINRIKELSENREELIFQLKKKLHTWNPKKVKYAATHYGTYSTQLTLLPLLNKIKHA